jgi:DNA-binding MarR family transcriptional regulator
MRDQTSGLNISLISELLTVDQLIRNRLAKVLPKGMELSHFSVLNHLAHLNAERTPAQLAKSFHVTRGAMTNTLNKLEVAGHIHIRPDWDDARRKMVAISPAGRNARDAAITALMPVISDIFDQVGEDRLKSVLPILRDLRLKMDAEG